MTSRDQKRPVGRRPGDSDATRQSILRAAREQFAARGYDRATIRAIAATAEVDPSLIIHYFQNKQKLFVEAHQLPIDPSTFFAAIGEVPPDARGAVLARAYLDVFTQPASPAISMLRAAATHDDAARMMREFVDTTLIAHAAGIVEGPDPELRAALIASHLFGVMFARQLLGVEALAQSDIDTLALAIAPALQQYIEGS